MNFIKFILLPIIAITIISCSGNAETEVQKSAEIKNQQSTDTAPACSTTKQSAVTSYDTTKQSAIDSYDTTKKGAVNSYDTTKQGVINSYDTTKQGVVNSYNAAKKDAVNRNLNEQSQRRSPQQRRQIVE